MFTQLKKKNNQTTTVVKKLKSLDDIEPLFDKSTKKPKKVLKSLDDVAPLKSRDTKVERHGNSEKSKAPVLVARTPALISNVPVKVASVQKPSTATVQVLPNAQAQTQPATQPTSPSIPAVVTNTEQLLPLSDVRKQSSNGYYPGLPTEERVARLASDGCTNEQIAMRLDMSLKAVMDARKKVRTKTLIQSPRDLFSSRLSDFNSAFDEALKMFNDTPDSEISYKILVEFMKTMRELVKDYNELEDPSELARQITLQVLRPLVQSVLSVIVANMKSTVKNVAMYLKEQERAMLVDSLTNGLRSLQDSVNGEYNNSVSTLEKIFAADLEPLKITAKSKERVEAGDANIVAEQPSTTDSGTV